MDALGHALFRQPIGQPFLNHFQGILRAMRKVLFGSSGTQRHDLFVNVMSPIDRDVFTLSVSTIFVTPKSIRYINKPMKDRSKSHTNWVFSDFSSGFPTSAKLRAAKFCGTSWAFAGLFHLVNKYNVSFVGCSKHWDNQDKGAIYIHLP